MLDRKRQPEIRVLSSLAIQSPERFTLPNGVPVNLIQTGDNEVVRIDVVIGGGRWHQQYPLQALFTNRMLREGTNTYTASQIAEKLDYYGAWLELSNSSCHSFVTLYSLTKYLPQTLKILSSLLKEPLFSEKELEVVVNNNLQQFKVNTSKVDFLAHRALVSHLYGGQHPCGRLVQEKDYKCLSTNLLRSFYDEHYHSKNCVFFLSGKVSNECMKLIEEYFGNSPFGMTSHSLIHKNYIPQPSKEKHIFIERPDAQQSAVRMGMLSLDCLHPDFLDLRVLITLLGGYFGSRLMANIRERKGYTYNISANILSYPERGVLVINAETTNEYVKSLIQEVYVEIERLQNDLVSPEELSIVRNYMIGDMCRSYESAFSLSEAWIFFHTSGVGENYFSNALTSIKEITPERIRSLAECYLCKETLKEVVSGKKNS